MTEGAWEREKLEAGRVRGRQVRSYRALEVIIRTGFYSEMRNDWRDIRTIRYSNFLKK